MPMPRGHHVHRYDRVGFGMEMRAVRNLLGLALRDLGEATGINKGSLQGAEAGRRSLPLAAREAIVTHLECQAHLNRIPLDGDRLRVLGGLVPEQPLITASPAELPREPAGGRAWAQSLREGHRLAASFGPAPALRAYRAAVKLADSPGARALATACEAHAWWKQDNFPSAMTRYRQALGELGLGALPPDAAPTIQAIEGRVRDEAGLVAYAQLARLRGSIHHTRGEYDRAILAYTAWERVGRILGDPTTRANALRYLGKSLLEQATFVDPEDVAWRIPGSEETIQCAIGYFQRARAIRGSRDGPGLAEDWRQELRARGVLLASRADRAARRAVDHALAEAVATAGAATPWSRLYLQVDHGRLQLAEVNLEEAEELLLESLDLAMDLKTPSIISGAMCGLGLVHSMSPARHREALDYAIASLLLWNLPFETRDSHTAIHLFHHLGGQAPDIGRFIASERPLRCSVGRAINGISIGERMATVVARLGL